MSPNNITPSPTYNIRGGDLFFSVDQTLFRVHSHFFLRESEYWKNELLVRPVNPHKQADEPFKKGNNALDPYVIKDEKPGDFSRLLWVFYNAKYGDYSKPKCGDWTAILRLAARWEFPEVKSLAVEHLERFDMDPIQRIRLYIDSHVDEKYLLPLYVHLASRDEVLGLEEARILGLETFVSIQQARELLRGRASSSNSPQSPLPAGIHREEIINTVASAFGISPADVDMMNLGNASSDLPSWIKHLIFDTDLAN